MEKYLIELEEYFYTCECFGDDVLAIRKDHLKQSLESVELDTARKIGEAAGQAGLVPKDLANPEDWKNALKTLEKEVRKDEREKVLKMLPKDEKKYDGNNLESACDYYCMAADSWIEIIRYQDGFAYCLEEIKSKLKQLNK